LLERRVAENETVQANQVLFVLSTDHATALGDTGALVAQSLAQRRITLEGERSLRELQARQRTQATRDRIRSTEAELRQAEGECQLIIRRVQLAEKSVARYRELAKSGFVAEIQAQQKQEELIDLQTRAQTTERNRLGLRRDVQSLRAELEATETQMQTELTQLDRGLASLQQELTENDARRQVLIVAPQAGIVTALNLSPGAAVQVGQALATLVPVTEVSAGAQSTESPLQAELYAPSRTAGFVQTGQDVWLRYAAFPYQKFGMAEGTVTSVSRTPINPQDLPLGQAQALIAAAQSNEPLYRITVHLTSQAISAYGLSQPLKPGMALEADVLQEKRAVWEWVFEPVLAASSMAKALSASPNKTSSGS